MFVLKGLQVKIPVGAVRIYNSGIMIRPLYPWNPDIWKANPEVGQTKKCKWYIKSLLLLKFRLPGWRWTQRQSNRLAWVWSHTIHVFVSTMSTTSNGISTSLMHSWRMVDSTCVNLTQSQWHTRYLTLLFIFRVSFAKNKANWVLLRCLISRNIWSFINNTNPVISKVERIIFNF